MKDIIVIEIDEMDYIYARFTDLESAVLRQPSETLSDITMDINIIAQAIERGQKQ